MNTPSFSRSGRFFILGTSVLGAVALLFTFITTATASSLPPAQFHFFGSNTPPNLINLAITTPIWENHTATLTGEIIDPDIDDTFTLDIDWGDGMTQTLTFPAGTTVFTATQLYLDDNPSGTPQDDYTVQLTLSDSAGNTDTDSTVLTVMNFAPQWTFWFPTAPHFDEGEPASARVIFTDMSPNDTFTYTISWGDSNVTTYTFPAGSEMHTLTHIYADDNPSGTLFDEYFLTHSWTDDDLGGREPITLPLGVTIYNIAPTLSNLAASYSSEENTTTLTGNITDPGILDTFTLAVEWGDNTVTTYTYPAGTTTFTETHTYTSGAETRQPASYTLSLTLTDDDTGQDTATVQANNAPTIISLSATTPINENGTTTLSGTFSDLDPQDTFTLTVDWGDGNVLTATYPAGAAIFSHPHTYLDDNSTNPYTITVTLMDNHTGTDTAVTTLTVNNVAPTITTLTTTSPIDENEATTLIGTFNDPGPLDTFTVLVHWGDGNVLTATYPAGATDFMHTHTYLDDPAGNATDAYTITVTLLDDDGSTDTDTTSVTVHNLAPTVDAGPDQTADDGTLLTFTGVFTEPGTLDTHTILWDFGDGITATGTLAATHLYAAPGVYTVTLTITDDDGGITQDTLQVTIQAVENPEYRIYLPLITH